MMNKNRARKGVLELNLGIALLILAVSWFSPMSAVIAGPQIQITPMETVIPEGTPTIPWVADGDNSWYAGKTLFEVTANDNPDLSAKGWMAVTSGNILIHAVVHHIAHLSGNDISALFAGDAIQFGIDPLGRGGEQPALGGSAGWSRSKSKGEN